MYISVRICKFEIFGQKSRFKKNVIAIAIAKNMPLYGQTLFTQAIAKKNLQDVNKLD